MDDNVYEFPSRVEIVSCVPAFPMINVIKYSKHKMHIVGDRLDTDQSVRGIGRLMGIEPGEVAVSCAIKGVQESYSRQHIVAGDFGG
jgi:hypothetical protein